MSGIPNKMASQIKCGSYGFKSVSYEYQKYSIKNT